ncbi:hypothetical protein PAXRUDRAFT_12679 [Paxillus rubicundulus Ve08.2h10]|uniref:C2H2-type domain-containing protein n=1 Tax=Paxillus rubicundulus Ve08.2h10 TaxID=930991 RepID=A0A0D0E0L7_9AGAM|nr:hypothetical protein PAXRUDRAFT_12679 [Paxillus rubicundulus Ve08.2h10]
MGDPTGNSYFMDASSCSPHLPIQPSDLDQEDILPHFPSSCYCQATRYQPSDLAVGDATQNISVQFMHSCYTREITQLDTDILSQRHIFDTGNPVIAVQSINYPESSQRATPVSHVSPAYTSRFSYLASCAPANPHLAHVAALPDATPTFGTGPLPIVWTPQEDYLHWMHPSKRVLASPASELAESTSDESYADSDAEETDLMSPMMNMFQVRSPGSPNLLPNHAHTTQALRPFVMTFQLSETMLHPVDDPEGRHILQSLLDMSLVAGDDSEVPCPPSSSSSPSSSPDCFRGAALQDQSTSRHSSERAAGPGGFRIQLVSSPPLTNLPFSSFESPLRSGLAIQRPSTSKQPKKSKTHYCEECGRGFPRPSGLSTHMNTHSGAKPYKCTVPSCDKRFAVRSNARRHLRTHGIHPSSFDNASSNSGFVVGFDEPLVTQVHDTGRQPSRYRWITQPPHPTNWLSPGSSTISEGAPHAGPTFQVTLSRSSVVSGTQSNGSDDDYEPTAALFTSESQHQHLSDHNRNSDEFSGTYPGRREHSR